MGHWMLVLLWLVMGLLCARLATKKGRNPAIWFVVGFVASWVGLLVLFILPAAKASETVEAPKQKNDDPMTIDVTAQVMNSEPLWFYLDGDHEQQGPTAESKLRSLWKSGVLKPASLVWKEGMSEWKEIKSIADLHAALRA